MTTDEAIEILIVAQGGLVDYHNQSFIEACILGIQALRRIKLGRKGVQRFAHTLLPDETADPSPLQTFACAPNSRPGVFVEYTGKP